MENTISFYYNHNKHVATNNVSSEYQRADYINEKLQMLREILRNIKFTNGSDLVDVELYVFNSSDINSLAIREEDGYAIVFSSAIFYEMTDELEGYFLNADLRHFFYGKKKKAIFHVNKIMDYCLTFLCLHEYYHILNGHCDLSFSFGHKVEKATALPGDGENRINQILEFDADVCATRSCIYLIFEKMNSQSERMEEIVFLGLAMYYLFLEFEYQSRETFEVCLNNMWLLDHPFASIRIVYSLTMIVYYSYLPGMSKKEQITTFKKLLEVCLYFERVYFESDNVGQALFALGYTKNGQQHILDLDNGWEAVKETLKEHAYIQLRDKLDFDQKGNAWITDEGDFDNSKINWFQLMEIEKALSFK